MVVEVIVVIDLVVFFSRQQEVVDSLQISIFLDRKDLLAVDEFQLEDFGAGYLQALLEACEKRCSFFLGETSQNADLVDLIILSHQGIA